MKLVRPSKLADRGVDLGAVRAEPRRRVGGRVEAVDAQQVAVLLGADEAVGGGDGIVREVEFLAPAQVSIVSDRRKTRPYGSPPGKPGRNFLNGAALPGKVNFRVKAGDRVRIETPGGGGV